MAGNNQPMTKCLAAYEQAYFISARGLYQQYVAGVITLDQARQEKNEVLEQYEKGKKAWEYFTELHELQVKLKQLKEQGFNSVLELEILESLNKLLDEQ